MSDERVNMEEAQRMIEVQKAPIERHSRLKEMYVRLIREKAPLTLARDLVRQELEALTQNPRIVELRMDLRRINSILGPMDMELAGLTRALGAKGIKMEAGHYTTKEIKGS